MEIIKTFTENLSIDTSEPSNHSFNAGSKWGAKEALSNPPNQTKPFITTAIYPLLNEVFKQDEESITTSRFTEILNEIAYKYFQEHSAWTNTRTATPALIEGKDYSENVLAIVEGYEDIQVMCYVRMPDDDNKLCYAWANAYGNIHADDAEWDEDYNVIAWQYLPKKPIEDEQS